MLFLAVCITLRALPCEAYPIDGFAATGIRRLAWLQSILDGASGGPPLTIGQKRSVADIQLRLLDRADLSLEQLPPTDPALQARLDSLFAGSEPVGTGEGLAFRSDEGEQAQ